MASQVSLKTGVLKPWSDLVQKLDTNNIIYGFVSEILVDSNNTIIGYKIKSSGISYDIYDISKPAQVGDLTILSVVNEESSKLASIISTTNYKVEITTVNVGLNDG